MRPIRIVHGLCLALALGACGDDGPADTGAVEVTTVSAGDGLDTDGYVAEVEGAGTLAIGINATEMLADVPAGDLEIRLTRVRGNCTVQGPHPRLIRVIAGEIFHIRFDVTCVDTPMLDRIVFYAYRDLKYDLWSMNTDGSDPVRLTDTPQEQREVHPAVSPDGRRILFTNRIGPEDDFYSEHLYVMNADGTEPTGLPAAGEGILNAAVWSPDGSRIAFGSVPDDAEYEEIQVINADGTGLLNLTNTSDVPEFSPTWSPDGDRIAFATPLGLEVMNSDGSGRRVLLSDASARSPVWSPDGGTIAFLSQTDTQSRLYVMNADGTDPQPLLADDGGFDYVPSWSPTGDRLALVRIFEPAVDIWALKRDGSGLVNLSNSDGFEYLGAQPWGP